MKRKETNPSDVRVAITIRVPFLVAKEMTKRANLEQRSLSNFLAIEIEKLSESAKWDLTPK